MGLAFKENCPDIRNTKVLTIINRLNDFNCKGIVDNWVSEEDATNNFNINLVPIENIIGQHAIIVAVGHREYCNIEVSFWNKMLKSNGVIIDVKSLYSSKVFQNTSISYWSLDCKFFIQSKDSRLG